MSDAVKQITAENRRRHAHNTDERTPRCRHCGSFVSKPAPENGRITYVCPSCDRAILEYVNQKQASRP